MCRLRTYLICILLSIGLIKYVNSTPMNNKEDSKIHRIKPHVNELLSYKNNKVQLSETNKDKTFDKKSHITNKQLFSKLGLSKIKLPSSHNRKRLAVQSRHHSRPDDSHMFIIKLPPNPYYYTNPKASEPKNTIEDNSKKMSFNFQSNGKPGRIYHWNIPVIKKMITQKSRGTSSRLNNEVTSLLDVKNKPTWSNPWENETIDKGYLSHALNIKSTKRKSPSIYAPVKPKVNKFQKYFPGNGKPKGFYIIKNSQKTGHFKKLIT